MSLGALQFVYDRRNPNQASLWLGRAAALQSEAGRHAGVLFWISQVCPTNDDNKSDQYQAGDPLPASLQGGKD
jgi:hypothetical protein